jgi:hypothetical protein
MVEFPDEEERRQMLRHLVGIEDNVWIQVGDLPQIHAIADEDLDRSDDEKTSAVHFLRFEFNEQQKQAIKNGARLAAGIDHKNCTVEIRPVAENIRRSLLKDFD